MTHWNNETNENCPLRKVVNVRPSVMNRSMVIESLECGHEVPRYTVEKARKRRRCVYCGQMADWDRTKEMLAPEFEHEGR